MTKWNGRLIWYSIYVPDDGYLAKCHEICKKHNVLLICDEIQTGLARTGKMLCYEWDGIKPDMVILGKALSGGGKSNASSSEITKSQWLTCSVPCILRHVVQGDHVVHQTRRTRVHIWRVSRTRLDDCLELILETRWVAQ